jgi:hypothetical protein
MGFVNQLAAASKFGNFIAGRGTHARNAHAYTSRGRTRRFDPFRIAIPCDEKSSSIKQRMACALVVAVSGDAKTAMKFQSGADGGT